MVGISTCPACGDFAHHGYCKPAIQTMLAEEKADHATDRKRMAHLELQVATLKQELHDERIRHGA